MTFPVAEFDADIVELLDSFYARGLKTVALVYLPENRSYDPVTDTTDLGAPTPVDGVTYGEKTEDDANGAPQREIFFAYRYLGLPNIPSGAVIDLQEGSGLWNLKTIEPDPSRSGVILGLKQ